MVGAEHDGGVASSGLPHSFFFLSCAPLGAPSHLARRVPAVCGLHHTLALRAQPALLSLCARGPRCTRTKAHPRAHIGKKKNPFISPPVSLQPIMDLRRPACLEEVPPDVLEYMCLK